MGELKNVFSWSFSAGDDFDQCRRRHYWKKYGSWGGWNKSASEDTKKAYMLKNMQNRWSLMGHAAEMSIMWMLKEHQKNNNVNSDDAWNQKARPFLTQRWNESTNGLWKQNPKKFCLLSEHYYDKQVDEKKVKQAIAQQIKNCIKQFEETILPRLSDIEINQEVKIITADMPGDVEHFTFEGVKIYAIPDYAYRIGDQIHIHDWKAGKVKIEQHRLQLSLYALWAVVKYQVKLENIFLYIEYLNEAKVFPFQINENDLENVKERVGESIGEMTEYLIEYDREENNPLPIEEWEITSDRSNCFFCNFKELCKTEFSDN